MAAQHVDPTRDQFKAFMTVRRAPEAAPAIHMLNVLRFREKAAYPDSHALANKGMSGAEAYKQYSKAAAPVCQRLGGRQVWLGRPEAVVIGPTSDKWDLAFVATYPNAEAFAKMVQDTEYKQAVVHRSAAIADSRLIRCEGLVPGASFGSKL